MVRPPVVHNFFYLFIVLNLLVPNALGDCRTRLRLDRIVLLVFKIFQASSVFYKCKQKYSASDNRDGNC